MDFELFRKTRGFIETYMGKLMKHEQKEHATVGVPAENYIEQSIGDRKFLIVQTNVFKVLMQSHYLAAHNRYPDKFGTGNAYDVIDAIYQIEPIFDSVKRFGDFLCSEQFAFIFEVTGNGFSDKVLRIDLFRHLKPGKQGFEFVGGLLHSLKHYSYKGLNLSIGSDVHDVNSLYKVLNQIILAFYLNNLEQTSENNYVSFLKLDGSYDLKICFYYEKNTEIFFINTIHKSKRKTS